SCVSVRSQCQEEGKQGVAVALFSHSTSRMDPSNGTTAAAVGKDDVSCMKVAPVEIFENADGVSFPIGSLALGFDTKEDWNEELREGPTESDCELSSPTLPRKKPPG
ncbi:hypothetical protein OTU49_016017, partial [Cherax quadricarinatus]